MPPKPARASWPKRKTLDDAVRDATPRTSPVDGIPRWVSQQKLQAIVAAHLHPFDGVPKTLGRTQLLAIAIKLNLVPSDAASVAPPPYLSVDELRQRLDGQAGGSKACANRKELIDACLKHRVINAEEANAPRLRADVAKRQLDAKDQDEVCRSCSLSALLRSVPGKDRIVEEIRKMAAQLSEVMQQRSLLVWLHLHRLLQENAALPDIVSDSNATFFRHCFTVGLVGASTKDDAVMTTIEAYEHPLFPSLDLFPDLQLPRGAGNAVSWAAKLYRTNFINHFVLLDKVVARVKRLASYSMFGVTTDEGEEEEEAAVAPRSGELHTVVCAVESGATAGLASSLAAEAVKIRSLLGLPADEWLTKRWLKANIEKSIRFTLQVANTMDRAKCEAAAAEAAGAKVRRGVSRGIKWVPTHGIGLHSVTLDASDLEEVLTRGKASDGLAVDVVRGYLRDGIHRQFGKHLAEHGLDFSGTLTTDGTSVSVHFHKAGKTARAEAATAATQGKATAAKQRRPVPRVLLLADPGRINMVTMAALVDGKPLFVNKRRVVFKLTGRQYYSVSGAHNAKIQRTRKRRCVPGLRTLDAALARASLKTGDVERVVQHIRIVNRHRREAWAFATSRGSAKQKLRGSAGRRRALDRFFSGVRRRLAAVLGREAAGSAEVVWGGAKFSPSGRGNLTVPTSMAFRVACRHFGSSAVHIGDEYATSQTCPKCFNQLVGHQGRRARWRGDAAGPQHQGRRIASVTGMADPARLRALHGSPQAAAATRGGQGRHHAALQVLQAVAPGRARRRERRRQEGEEEDAHGSATRGTLPTRASVLPRMQEAPGPRLGWLRRHWSDLGVRQDAGRASRGLRSREAPEAEEAEQLIGRVRY